MDLVLLKQNCRELRSHIFNENDINNWNKIIILYNIYLFFNHIYMLYMLLEYFRKDTLTFQEQFKNVYLFFFLLCNLKNSYLYFILNISKIDKNLANSMFQNTKIYFV